jgi:hypothetical protein
MTSKSNKRDTKKNKKQKGGDITDQVAIGTAFTVINDRKADNKNELTLIKHDIVYIISSPPNNWWLGISRSAVEKALLQKKSKEDVHQVIVELIDYLYKNPQKIKESHFGNLLGWFPVRNVKLYVPKKSVIQSLMKSFEKIPKSPVELTIQSATPLQKYESLPSPTAPYVKRKLSNIPARK